MSSDQSNLLHVASEYQPIFREIGLDAESIFDDPRIKCWRKLADRENCTLDATLAQGKAIRFHIKRYPATQETVSPAQREVKGFDLLAAAHIPAPRLVGWGRLADRRSFIITDNLDGHQPADKMIASGFPFERLLNPLADLTAKLHSAGLHHRDLYLCHFFVKADDDQIDLKLIDVTRVKKLPGFPWLRRRWIVKDLAQFWYSTLALPINDRQRDQWLSRYAQAFQIRPDPLKHSVQRKVIWIGRHDARLRIAQPGRNISLPE